MDRTDDAVVNVRCRHTEVRFQIDLSALQLLILDEADKMVDSRRGFGYDVAEIFSMIPDETRVGLQFGAGSNSEPAVL